ncbi:MAG: Re/Si-specific NAD(P)(+) transhydrogenase subunit alpha [Gammaproteobacteria bacterium]|nr:Re/Si-specific NAD(P)(+) transhydrogenase subunit alpha [Gammaproteobacteria bacterium]
MALTIGVVTETTPGETRVALVPEVLRKLTAAGAHVMVQQGAGLAARVPDEAFDGAELAADADSVLAAADVLLKVQPPTAAEVAGLKSGATVIGFMQPHQQADMIRTLCDRNVTSFAMELVPRISRAQSMDALSSQAAVAGYKAVLIGAAALDKFMPMLTTAAGTIRPAQALVIGAGVAGLQAIATARRLGAVIEGFDVRSATKEQVESLGAKFIDTGVTAEGEGGYARELTEEERRQQQEVLESHIVKADLVVTTAAVPGRPAPRIISKAIVERMHPGAVIVDLAAESGGNCELTEAGETVHYGGVTIIGPISLAATVARHASEMYSRNLFNLLQPAVVDGELKIDWDDEVFAGAVLTRDGQICHEPTRQAISGTD